MKPILSISILLSTHDVETAKKCLSSIQPLLDIGAELLVTDTGCSPEVRSVAETYTDQIIDFHWCDDFSAARNVGLRQASGEWFLYLDDDEWFEDVSCIIEFLQSPEQKNYEVAFYIQRNYMDWEGTKYQDHYVDRLLRIKPTLHFEHRIHEAYVGLGVGEKKVLSSYVHHYGYLYADDEARRKKHQRNQHLLELECREHPDNMRMWYQLVINQYGSGDWDAAIAYARQAIARESDSEYWDACHTEILYCLEKQQKWEVLIQNGHDFLQKEIYPYDRFGILQYMISAYWQLGYMKGICCIAGEVLEIYRQYKEKPEIFNRQQLMREFFVKKDRMIYMLLYITVAAMCLGREDLILEMTTGATADIMRQILGNADLEQWIAGQVSAHMKKE